MAGRSTPVIRGREPRPATCGRWRVRCRGREAGGHAARSWPSATVPSGASLWRSHAALCSGDRSSRATAGAQAKRGAARHGPWSAVALGSSSGWPREGRRRAHGPGSRAPARRARRSALPGSPVTARTTGWRLRCIGVRALCRGWLGWLASASHRARCRQSLRRTHPWSGGRHAPASRPTGWRRGRPGPSWTSRLGRPVSCCTGCGSPSSTAQPFGSTGATRGLPEPPVAASATVVSPPAASPSAQASQATGSAPTRRTGGGSARGGPATSCAAAPMSLPAACRVTAASWGGSAGWERACGCW